MVLPALQTEALLSGLAFRNSDDKDQTPQWIQSPWPPMLGGGRSGHASIVVEEKNDSTETGQQTVLVVLGGLELEKEERVDWGGAYTNCTNSVLLLNLGGGGGVQNQKRLKWREGPRLGCRRYGHAVVLCNKRIYVVGGNVECIETIDLTTLLRPSCCALQPYCHHDPAAWKSVRGCELSERRIGCAAAVVHNRYIVVAGGHNGHYLLGYTEIIDTVAKTVVAGPCTGGNRLSCGMTVLGNRVYVVGGSDKRGHATECSVEYLEFQMDMDDTADEKTNKDAAADDDEGNKTNMDDPKAAMKKIFPGWCWEKHEHLVLSAPRTFCEIAKVGSCFVIVGRLNGSKGLISVEVWDTERDIQWTFPQQAAVQNDFSVVSLSSGMALIGVDQNGSSYTLTLMDAKAYLQDMFSCREELETAIKNTQNTIHEASLECEDVTVLQQAAKAEMILPFMKSLRNHGKFRTVQDLQEEIYDLKGQVLEQPSFRERIPLAKRIGVRQELKAKNFALRETADETDHAASSDASFYHQLVKTSDANVGFKLFQLANLVSNPHQMKIFYTFAKQLYRAKQISHDDWTRYTLNALQQVSMKIASRSNEKAQSLMKKIVEKCQEDGINVKENIISCPAASKNSLSSEEWSRPDCFPNKHEFRVGEVLPLSAGKASKTQSSSNHDRVLAQVQTLGRALKEYHSAVERNDHGTIAVAIICSLLNALAFASLSTRSALHAHESLLSTIVDYADIAHISSIVNESGNHLLHDAYKEGCDIVEQQVSRVPEDTSQRRVTRSTSKNRKKDLSQGTVKANASIILTSSLGQLVPAAEKWMIHITEVTATDDETRSFDTGLEAVTLLALGFTIKFMSLFPSVKSDHSASTETRTTCVSSKATSRPAVIDIPNSSSSTLSMLEDVRELCMSIESRMDTLEEEVKNRNGFSELRWKSVVDLMDEHLADSA